MIPAAGFQRHFLTVFGLDPAAGLLGQNLSYNCYPRPRRLFDRDDELFNGIGRRSEAQLVVLAAG